MSQKPATTASLTSRTKTASLPVKTAMADPAPTPEEAERRPRQVYQPKTATDYEVATNTIAERIRGMKSALYPSGNGKAVLDHCPTRSEFDSLVTQLNSLKKDYRAMARLAEQKPKRRSSAPSDPNQPAKRFGFNNPSVVKEDMAQFIHENFNSEKIQVIDDSRITTRALLTSIFNQYISDHNCRDPNKSGRIVPDQALKNLFKEDFIATGVNSESFEHKELQKLITRHVLSASEASQHFKDHSINPDEYDSSLTETQNHFKELKERRDAQKKTVKRVK